MRSEKIAAIGLGLRAQAEVPDRENQRILKLQSEVATLFDELRQAVYRYLVCLGMRPEEAEEIVQETFLRLYEHLQKGSKDENVRSWIFRVAHNISINEIKRRKYTAGVGPDFWTAVTGSRADPSPSPEDIFLCNERMARVQTAMSSLSEQQKQCLFLRAEGFRYREIAEILGVSISTVAESLRRAIRKLTNELP